MWAVHDYQIPRSNLYTERIERRYGKPNGLEDYCRTAQLVNLESAKAMLECLRSRRGGGQLVWMTQAAWPALICQLYDYYFEQTAAYFGAKTACEPLHILWDQASNIVKVANDTISDRKKLRAEAWVYDVGAQQRWHHSIDLDVPSTSVSECFPLGGLGGLEQVFFVRLQLREGGAVCSDNFYWSPAPGGDCIALQAMPRMSLTASAHVEAKDGAHKVTVSVSNPASSIALAVRLKIVRDQSRERVLPAMYEDNYFSLLPGESKTVHVRFPDNALAGESPRLTVTGWNVLEENHNM
jgi:hypothetical protein